MKLAYIAYDLNSLKAHGALSKHFTEIEYFLVETNRAVLKNSFEQIPVMVDQVCIPMDNNLITLAHKRTFNDIKSQYSKFKKEIFSELKSKSDLLSEATPVDKYKVAELNSLKDVFFDSKKQKVYVEAAAGVSEYDFLMVEDHELISNKIKNITSNIFQNEPRNHHVWFSVEFGYELKKPRTGALAERSFWLINDSQNESLVDNWYFCHFKANTVLVQQWVPFTQHQNMDYKKFMTERTQAVIAKKIEFIHVTEILNTFVDSTSGFFKNVGTLKNNRIAALTPSFSFWSQPNIESTVLTVLDPKIKKLLKLEAARGLS